ncbi:MAG: hypothetical protein RJB66_326 [Pseudomonadota bacterium]
MKKCPHAEECSGCSLWGTEYSQQIEIKTARLANHATELGYEGPIHCHELGGIGIRDRADMQWRLNEGWGFLNKDFKKLKVVDHCPLFSEELQTLYQWWSRFKLNAAKASVRLRVSSEGQWGVWLDMANIEVKSLLLEDELLSQWTHRAHVEVGQRFKVLKKINDHWKLVDPELRSWFSTCDLQGQSFSLFGSIGSFSQAGHRINHLLVKSVLQQIKQRSLSSVVELGAGAGNFTLAMAAEGFKVKALEQSNRALEGLQQSIELYPHLAHQIDFTVGNFQKLNWGDWAKTKSLLFLDPPRSGVGENLLRQIPQGDFPSIMYVACGLEAWCVDGKSLRELGYSLKALDWVDQFPNTPLYEIVSFWEKIQ